MRSGGVLIVVAAPREVEAVCAGFGVRRDADAAARWEAREMSPGWWIVESGIGKANAAGATARSLDPERHRAVLNLGIAGLLSPGAAAGLGIGSAVAATRSLSADEGIRTPDGWVGCAAMGFPLTFSGEDGVDADPGWLGRLRALADGAGVVATVSECAGTDQRAEEVARRTGAVAEAMEGAAVGQVAARLGVPFAELRVVSNTTGDRPRQRWDLPGALARLESVCRVLGRDPASGG